MERAEKNIISSRVSLVRNVENYPFVDTLPQDMKKSLEDEFIEHILVSSGKSKAYSGVDISKESKNLCVEQGLLNQKEKEEKFAVLPSERMSFVFNYKDHLKITAVYPGYKIPDLYRRITRAEAGFSKEFQFAASSKFGYLSPYIEHCGLGLRLSVLVHLPGLTKSNELKKVRKKLFRRGYRIEKWNLNVDDSCYYTVSSALNYGVTEAELLKRFEIGINQLLDIEKELLMNYYNSNNHDSSIEDIIYRSLGTLKHTRSISRGEAMNHIANLMTGLSLGLVLDGLEYSQLNRMLYGIQEENVAKFAKRDKINNRDALILKEQEARALYIRDSLEKGENDV